jgi:hypothetical protein
LGLVPGQQRNHQNTPSPLSTTDADTFQDIFAAQGDQLLTDFATAALTLPLNEQLREEHMTTNLAHGPNGKSNAS